MQKSYVEGAMALVLYCGRLLDEEKSAGTTEKREQAHLLLDVLTRRHGSSTCRNR